MIATTPDPAPYAQPTSAGFGATRMGWTGDIATPTSVQFASTLEK